MKKRNLFLAAFLFALSFMLIACHGLIPPKMGDTAVISDDTTSEVEVGEYTGIQPGGEGEGEGEGGDAASSGGGDDEEVVAPVMVGNVVYHFHHEEMKSSSLGALEQFTADADLFDEMNADGFNGAIHLTSGDSEAYQTFVWTQNEDGTLSLQTDEFNIFEAKEINGVLTILGIRYQMGMMNKGAVDIPLAEIDPSYVPIGQGVMPGEAASEGGEAASEGGEAPAEGAPAEGAPQQ